MRTATEAATTTGVDLRVESVGKRFGELQVLDDVSLTVPAGSTTCVIGPSGSGKSTLLRCVNRLEEPTSGRIYLGDTEVTARDVDIDDVRSRVGIVFQHFNLFPHMSVLRNIMLALRKVRGDDRTTAEAKAMARLADVGLADYAQRRPGQLSGGQQQRVAIARALAMDPDVMLFDEATSALDPELVKGVLQIMRSLADGGMTMLIVTHELRFAREVAQQVAFLDEGALVEYGPPDQLFEAPASDRLQHFLSQML